MRNFESWKRETTGLHKIRWLGGSMIHETPPGTLAEVMEDMRRGISYTYAINSFLVEFDTDDDADSLRKRLEDAPQLTPNPVINAMFGAAAEHLTQRCRLGEAPSWAFGHERYLREPCFLLSDKERAFAESPPAYRRRNLYTHAKPMKCSEQTLSIWSFEYVSVDDHIKMTMGP